ncbi:hypothetical protein T484DRAFT_1815985 [Baffinella frigidus]|nr:hypothetical protein T484DRAFT_1815985 [Cryptophyta sp. CCMP2293]
MARLPLAALAVLVLLCGGTGVLAMNATNATNATNQETQAPRKPFCSPLCSTETMLGDGTCDPVCMTASCQMDGGDRSGDLSMDGGDCGGDLSYPLVANYHFMLLDTDADGVLTEYELITGVATSAVEMAPMVGKAVNASVLAAAFGKVMDKGAQGVTARQLQALAFSVVLPLFQGDRAKWTAIATYTINAVDTNWTGTTTYRPLPLATYTINAFDSNWDGMTTCEEMNGARPDVAAACVEGMGQTFDVPLLAQRGINIDHQGMGQTFEVPLLAQRGINIAQQMGGEGRAWLGDEKGLRRALLLFSFITDVDGMPDSLSRFEAGGIFGINDAWFQSVDLDGDGALSVEEEMVMVTVLGQDACGGFQDACGGFQVVEDTAGEINKGIPITPGVCSWLISPNWIPITPGVCSWLISPNWFYKQATGGAQGAQTLSQEKATHLDQPSLRRQIPKESRAAAHASHARTAKLEQSLRTRQAARLRSREQVTTRGIDGVAAGAAFDFVAWISGVSAHLCSGALIHATYVATTAECVLQVRGYLAEGKQALVHLGLSQGQID